jgi:putative ABC transport system permease protein
VSLLADLTERVRALFFRGRVERELDEELRAHVAFEMAERLREGLPPDEARRQALVAFGGVEKWKEETRAARGLELLEGFLLDLRHSLRSLGRNPGFTVAVIGVLGLGIGAATAVFSVVRTVLLTELPYPHADRLVRIYQKNSPTNLFGLSTVDVQAIEEQQRSFDAFGVVQRNEAALAGTGSPERVAIGRATAGWFRVLGVSARSGRVIAKEDELPGAPAVTVVSYALAEHSLGGADAAVGRSITLDGVSHTVVGVLPPAITELGGISAVAWPALQLQAPTRRGPFWLRGIGRLREGATIEAATEDLAGISERLFPAWASTFRDQSARLTPVPLRRTIVGDTGQSLALFGAAVALVLLIAIANVATLMLVRASAREQELAVRTALGANRSRLARLLLTESVSLTLVAGAAGLAIAWLALQFLVNHTASLPRMSEVGLDGPAAFFAIATALVCGLVISLSPISALLADGERRPRAGGARVGIDRKTSRLRATLVVAEFALALPLLLGAGLLLNSFLRLSRVDPGFTAAGIVAVNLSLPRARYPDGEARQRFWDQVENLVSELPGTGAVGLITAMPPDDPGDINNFDLLDRPVQEGSAEPVSPWMAVTPGYFAALGIPLLEGRGFSPGDSGEAAPVVIVSRSWAATYYPGERAVGRQLYSGGCHSCPPSTVIGVVGDVKYLGLSGSAEAAYEPVAQYLPSSLNLVIRTALPGETSFPALTAALNSLDPELPVSPGLLTSRLRASLADPERWMAIVAGFALAAALLAALGIYGLMSYVVRQRQREIGVRIALGAEPASVTRMVIGRGMRHALVGSLLGLGLALIAGRWVGALLYQVSPWDPLTLASVVGLIVGAAFVSCWVPGRRAARMRLPEALGTGD